ncbi:MAG TPA: alpha/beta fold hydrolase [Planctomycetaceae bacterium]|jgi:predicted alpha/beta hydrolase|nr:alpha/beta fold hydrolase [Planctomycetaceae bacterium]
MTTESANRVESGKAEPQPVEFAAADGTPLSGRFFAAANSPRSNPVLVCAATDVPQRFYTAFARWISEQGVAVLTFDYRGIGASLRESHVRHCRARKQDWGQFDMPAALDWLRERTGVEAVDVVGHSAGAQLVGLMSNHTSIRRVLMVAASSGYVWGLRFPYSIAAYGYLRFYLPATAWGLGYSPGRAVGMGEDLPAGVARQWSRWCLRPGYVANEFGRGVARHYYDEFRAPILSLYASDDSIATVRNVEDLLRLFPSAPKQSACLEPSRFNVPSFGHIDFFRGSRAAAWPVALDWLREGKSPQPTAV